jgi:hypothetical protein
VPPSRTDRRLDQIGYRLQPLRRPWKHAVHNRPDRSAFKEREHRLEIGWAARRGAEDVDVFPEEDGRIFDSPCSPS